MSEMNGPSRIVAGSVLLLSVALCGVVMSTAMDLSDVLAGLILGVLIAVALCAVVTLGVVIGIQRRRADEAALRDLDPLGTVRLSDRPQD